MLSFLCTVSINDTMKNIILLLWELKLQPPWPFHVMIVLWYDYVGYANFTKRSNNKFQETIRQKQHMASIKTLYDHNLAVCILPTITLFLRGKKNLEYCVFILRSKISIVQDEWGHGCLKLPETWTTWIKTIENTFFLAFSIHC
jgi:hypothetical protein